MISSIDLCLLSRESNLRGWSLRDRYTDKEIIDKIEEIILRSVQEQDNREYPDQEGYL